MMSIRSFTRHFFLFAVVVGLGFLASCAPRGETKSLDEVFQIAKARYERGLASAELSTETSEKLTQLTGIMDSLLQASSDNEVVEAATRAEALLGELVTQSAYTNRPAMGEISKAYRSLTGLSGREVPLSVSADPSTSRAVQDAGGITNADTRKLLVARSYNLLAQELETTSFQVEKAGV
ncbi:hypothetical protein EBR25_04095 [bacterium]|nr:hypothetical protein [bacterium]